MGFSPVIANPVYGQFGWSVELPVLTVFRDHVYYVTQTWPSGDLMEFDLRIAYPEILTSSGQRSESEK